MAAWGTYDLDMKDYRIFLSLERNPSQSNVAISKEVGMSAEAVRIRLQRMKAKGFLRPDRQIDDPVLGRRTQTEVEAVYSPSRLGLLRQHVLFLGIHDVLSMSRLKKLCDEHPYTHYRVAAYGDGAAMYVQFDIPPDISGLMESLYRRLRDLGLFEQFVVKTPLRVARLQADFERWSLGQNRWSLDYGRKAAAGSRLSRLESVWDRFLANDPQTAVPPIRRAMVHDFDNLDMSLLRELTINAKPNLRRLGELYNRDATTISRRVKRLRHLVIRNELLYYDRSVFDLTYTQMIAGHFRAGSDLSPERLHRFVMSGEIPFECQCIGDDESFLLFVTSAPSFAPEFSEFFWEHATRSSVYQLQLNSSFTYFFYHKNYFGRGEWNTSRDYVLDTPLASIS